MLSKKTFYYLRIETMIRFYHIKIPLSTAFLCFPPFLLTCTSAFANRQSNCALFTPKNKYGLFSKTFEIPQIMLYNRKQRKSPVICIPHITSGFFPPFAAKFPPKHRSVCGIPLQRIKFVNAKHTEIPPSKI